MTSDLDLLRQFTRDRSQDAFTELVKRHVNLVYSAALRQVRSPQLAEVIAQSVFADLARVAATPSSPAGDGRDASSPQILTPWLYAVTRRTAIDVIRKESRRQLREQIAVEMNNMNATANDWNQIEPLLDDAMAALDETDRSAILLRYFKNKNLREVGEALGTSDDAAQKRVSRAVERLREFFSKRNVTVGASGLAILISANAVQSAPVGLALTICTATLAGTAISASTIIAATKTIAMTTLQKTIITAVLTAVAGTGIFEAHQASQLREQNQMLQQQQAPLAEQIQQLQRERNDATNRLASLLAENQHLKENPNQNELLKLRGEVTRLQNADNQRENDPTLTMAKSWLNRIDEFKKYVEQHPNDSVPEVQVLSENEWLSATDPWNQGGTNYGSELELLRGRAVVSFSLQVQSALSLYAQANNGNSPTTLSQLQPYCEPSVEDILQQEYEVKPVNILSADLIERFKIKSDWVIARKEVLNPGGPSNEKAVISAGFLGSY